MFRRSSLFAVLALATLSVPPSARAQSHQKPPGMTHGEHLKQMEKEAELKRRGAAAMGFDQTTTTHHFLLSRDGGSVEVTANEAADTTSLEAIRTHLKEIAGQFSRGDFGKPLATHGEQPDGVADMIRLRRALSYSFDPMAGGGRVRIKASSPAALEAVHRFLRYQIREHATGDRIDVPK